MSSKRCSEQMSNFAIEEENKAQCINEEKIASVFILIVCTNLYFFIAFLVVIAAVSVLQSTDAQQTLLSLFACS